MTPILTTLVPRSFDPLQAAVEFRAQWIRPSDVFSVLLILGGDVVARALAQVAGSGLSTVAFSFGWATYAISALVSAVGENKLMVLSPDCRCKVINGKSGYAKDNSSWIIARIVRDYDHWRHPDVEAKMTEVLKKRQKQLKLKDPNAKLPPIAGLIVSIYEPSRTVKAGTVKRDSVYWIGIPVMVVQLGIAAIPCGLFGDWGIFIITTCGIVLSLTTGLLPQWKKEKWACRSNTKHSFILTRGNGSQHAIVVLGDGHGFCLEDLASGQGNVMVKTDTQTRIALLALATLWTLLLITAAGLKANSWFLLAVGGIGILQNIYVAGAQRKPENFGVPLDYRDVIGDPSAMETLFQVEEKYEGVGRSMLGEFFPGCLRENEYLRWEALKNTRTEAEEKSGRRSDAGNGLVG
ncbi:hypothetical protein GP486_007195 [Trichoglossum hirsutum]|uniref:Uncharacterized protein n=1 Tax=Trichoglossum hirsutum TaxID=265104 RepID=A0A9P8IJM6_9PEZI|nr:hypothetical protein GP486_007195 [Trichoglossum hirsutum]